MKTTHDSYKNILCASLKQLQEWLKWMNAAAAVTSPKRLKCYCSRGCFWYCSCGMQQSRSL